MSYVCARANALELPTHKLTEAANGNTKEKRTRDIEKNYPVKHFINKLRRLADCIEQGRRFQIQVAGERISIPSNAIINIEHERGDSSEEVEFQLTWLLDK